jgi:fibronectin-binding autotransporter adhesin
VTVTGTFSAIGESILTGGQLVNQGTGTLDSSVGLYLANGATFTNSGTLAMDQSSNIDGYGCGTAGVFDNTGTLDVAPGSSQTAYIGDEECGLTVNDSATIDLQSGTLENKDSGGFIFHLDTGSSIAGTGTFEDEGDLVANATVSISTLDMVGGTLELAPQVDIDAISFSGTSGTVKLDAGSPTEFGQIVATNSVSPTDLSLNLNPTFSPTCGESVTALRASSVSGPFEFAEGPTPLGGAWRLSNAFRNQEQISRAGRF